MGLEPTTPRSKVSPEHPTISKSTFAPHAKGLIKQSFLGEATCIFAPSGGFRSLLPRFRGAMQTTREQRSADRQLIGTAWHVGRPPAPPTLDDYPWPPKLPRMRPCRLRPLPAMSFVARRRPASRARRELPCQGALLKLAAVALAFQRPVNLAISHAVRQGLAGSGRTVCFESGGAEADIRVHTAW